MSHTYVRIISQLVGRSHSLIEYKEPFWLSEGLKGMEVKSLETIAEAAEGVIFVCESVNIATEKEIIRDMFSVVLIDKYIHSMA